jgi:dipeptidyl aminopeptidase/acylaminoacyl peptidase
MVRLFVIAIAVLFFAGPRFVHESNGAEPGSLHIAHPDDTAKHVEYFIEKPSGTGPWPTVVLLHGHQDGLRPGGKDFVDWGVLKQFAARGYLAVAISQPGYGKSDGPPDFCGPFTQHAVSAVIAHLRKEHLVAPKKLVIEGISRGALTAGLVAAHDPSVSGIVLISGVYDLPAYVADAATSPEKSLIAKSMLAESGGTPDALKERSVLHVADKIQAAALILNGAKDTRTDPNQAQRLADQITKRGGQAKAIIYPDLGHKIPIELRNKHIDPFIDQLLQPK